MSFLEHPLDQRPVIIGAGLAGLMTALSLAPMPVLVLSGAALGEGAASGWAQGGLAAAIGAGDSVEAHVADTLAAGDGLCDAQAVRAIIAGGPALVERLRELGARFDCDSHGEIKLGLEAGHGARRIVHAQGDGSGREILRAVIAAVRRTPSIAVLENMQARRLILRDGRIAGVLAAGVRPDGGDGAPLMIRSSRVVLATGGAGSLFAQSTNPPGAVGGGVMLAAAAGAMLADMEFIQFHPTALDIGADPMPLVSEAVRGEGAVLINGRGERFMAGQGRAELEPRDIVARAVWAQIAAGERVFLDARDCLGARFAQAFPAIFASLQAAGIDPATMPIPIRPAAHYAMGGVATDLAGRTSVDGLWAAGEVACTGLHGANRLASNSLLEAGVMGQRVAADIAGSPAGRAAPLALVELPPAPDARAVRPILARDGFVLRDAGGLRRGISQLLPLLDAGGAAAGPAALGLAMMTAMHVRQESRGGHARTDYRQAKAGLPRRFATLREAITLARQIAAGQAVQRGVAR